MKNKELSPWIIILIVAALLLTGCGKAASTASGQIKGVLVQKAEGIAMSGSIKLMAEKYQKATPAPNVTLKPDEFMEVNIEKGNKFTLNNIQPGKYFLDVAVSLKPCFLGRPGEAFNGMKISFMDNWSPVGLSLKDGSSLITGETEVFEIAKGQSLDIKLYLPDCY